MAGLCDQWTLGERVRSCAVIVTAANTFTRTRTIHDRMPVRIEPKDFGLWLSSEAGIISAGA
jgi:putative SOS response-associated peptidase YedK